MWPDGLARVRGSFLRKLPDGLDRLGYDTGGYVRVQTLPHEGSLGLKTVTVVGPTLLPVDFGWDCRRALRRTGWSGSRPGNGPISAPICTRSGKEE